MHGLGYVLKRPAEERHEPASIRLRLTLWNVGVLALMLAGLGVGLHYTLKVTLMASVDRGLTRFGSNIQRRVDAGGLGPDAWHPPGRPPSGQADPHDLFHPRLLDTEGHSVIPDEPATPYDPAAFRQALAGRRGLATVQLAGQPVRLLTIPLRRNGRIVGVAQVPRSLLETKQEVQHLTSVLLSLAVPALLIAGLGGAFLTSRALRPIRHITSAAGRIEAENLSGRLPVTGPG